MARHPGTGRRLARGFGAKSARAFDATFSAPKSVSVLWALSPDPFVQAEVLAAHDVAVQVALDWFERHGAVTPRGKDGVHQVDTQGVTVALFRQHTSRTADPQLHTHAIVAAKVQDPTGKWLSLDARFLKRQQRTIGWVYAAALRAELTARLGVGWGPVAESHADIAGVPTSLFKEFSKRSEQAEARLAELVAEWADAHDGAEPEPRTLYRLDAWLSSKAVRTRSRWATPTRCGRLGASGRPALVMGCRICRPALRGCPAPSTAKPSSARPWSERRPRRRRGSPPTWPARSRHSSRPTRPWAAALVALVDELTAEAAGKCVELHPAAAPGTARRRDGRPITEHVVDRQLTTTAVWRQEARLLGWARTAVGPRPAMGHIDGQAAAADAVAGHERLVLVVGPAGAGKTSTLGRAARLLADLGRPTIGLAPSGKAADVLAAETGWPAATLARLLHEHDRSGGAGPAWRLPAGTTVALDEASMASTDDVDALVALVERQRWRLVCVGDPAQLPAVGRGGMFALWCERLPAHRLEEVRRFADNWQAEASLHLRRGEPAAARAYTDHHRLHSVHPALVADRVARQFARLTGRGATVTVTTASAGTARAINVAIQHWRNPRRQGEQAMLADGTAAFVGDRVATRRNLALVTDRGAPVRNRQTWTVNAVAEDGSLDVADAERGSVRLPAEYVARHVELGWAVTGYGSQGVTTDHNIAVVEPSSTRAGIYVAMTRGRDRNLAWIVDGTGLADPEEALAAAIARPPNAHSAHAVAARLGGGPAVVEDDTARRMARRLEQLGAEQRPTPVLRR